MRTFWGIAMLIFFNTPVMSQSFPVLPVRFCQYTQAYHRINPSIVNYDYKASVFSGVQTSNLAFNTIYTYYTSFQLVLNRSSSTNQAIGVNLTGDHEGELLRHTGIYLLYAIEIPLTDNVRLGSGISLGIMNYLIKATPVNGGGSDLQPDGSLGIAVRGNKWHVGAAIDQMFNRELQPIEERSQLVRHLNFTADKIFELSPFFAVKACMWVRWFDEDLRDINLGIESVLGDRLRGGVVVNYAKEAAFTLGIDNIDVHEGVLDLSFSYGIMTGKNYLSSKQNYELTLRYHFQKRESR